MASGAIPYATALDVLCHRCHKSVLPSEYFQHNGYCKYCFIKMRDEKPGGHRAG
jgi:hypothetical protein